MMRQSLASAAAAVVLLATRVEAQTMENGCLRLLGSVACPGCECRILKKSTNAEPFFPYVYSLLRLSLPFQPHQRLPFFSTVTDVSSFDTGALDYFSNQYEFETTKFINELGCSNATNAVIRWERTVLCSMWVNEMWSTACLAYYSESSQCALSPLA